MAIIRLSGIAVAQGQINVEDFFGINEIELKG